MTQTNLRGLIDDLAVLLALAPGPVPPAVLGRMVNEVRRDDRGDSWNGAKLNRELEGHDLRPVVALRGARDVTAYEVPLDAVPDVLGRAASMGKLPRYQLAVATVIPPPDFTSRFGGYRTVRAGGADYRPAEVAACELRVALTLRSAPGVARALQGFDTWNPERHAMQVCAALPMGVPADWLAQLPAPVVKLAAQLHAVQAMGELRTPNPAYVAHIQADMLEARAALAVLHGLRGDARALDATPAPREAEAAGHALARLVMGDVEGCLAIGNAETSGTKKRRDAFLRHPFAAAYLAACVVSGRADVLERARAMADDALPRTLESACTACMVLAVDARASGQSPTPFAWNAVLPVARRTWFDALFAGLACAWLGAPESVTSELAASLRGYAAEARAAGMDRLADEFTACERRIVTGEVVESTRLAFRVRNRAPWEAALERLEVGLAALGEPQAAAPKAARERVLGFTVYASEHGVTVQPTVAGARSRGAAPKPVTLEKLLTSEAGLLTEHDRRVLARARRVAYGRAAHMALGEEALPELVGHGQVVDGSGRPLAIEEVEPRLSVSEQASGFVVRFFPAIVAGTVAYSLPERGRMEVARIDPAHGTLASATTRDGLRVPRDARDRLGQLLAGVGARIRVEGLAGSAELVTHAETVDARLRVQLFRVSREGLRALLRVRPLGEHGPSVAPGVGASSVVGERDGKPLRGERDLAAERRALATFRAAHPALAAWPSDGSEVVTGGLEATLELLLALGAPHGATLEWPEGDALKLPATATKLVVRASAERDWFAVTGSVEADDESVIAMQSLLEAGRKRYGRFVELDTHRYLALTEGVEKQLEALDAATDRKGKALRMHPLVAHALAEAGSLPLSLDADAEARLAPRRSAPAKVPRGFAAELRDYQREGFAWLSGLGALGAGGILADDMGLGKTVQALALLDSRRKGGPALVVAPTSVTSGWLDQGARFAPDLRFVDLGALGRKERAARIASLAPGEVGVVSYGLLTSHGADFEKRAFHTLVLDEAQALKNAGTQRTQAARGLGAELRVALTGTPIENHLLELHSLIDLVLPGLLGSEKEFERRFAGPIRGGDRRVLGILRTLLRPFVLRRTKAQVLEELPPRTEVLRVVVPTDEERAFHEALRRQAVAAVEAADAQGLEGRMRVLAEIGRLRRAATDPRLVEPGAPASSKLAELRDLVAEIRESGHRALIFGQFLDALATVRADLEADGVSYLYLDGSTPAKERAARVRAFQDGEGDVFLISLKAGGTGLNLTGADTVVLMDPWWNPAVEDQAADRTHRIGQTRPVTVIRMVTAGTLEERIVGMHGDKRALAADVLEGLDARKKLDVAMLRALITG